MARTNRNGHRPAGEPRGSSDAPSASEAAAQRPASWGCLPGELLELVAQRVPWETQLHMCAVNRHWRAALLRSRLWESAELEFSGAGSERCESMLAWALARAEGIRSLAASYEEVDQWATLGFLLGALRGGLRHLEITGEAGLDSEMPAGHAAFLWTLRGLTSLHLDSCLEEVEEGLGRLTALRELRLARDDCSYGGHDPYCLPASLSALQQLTRLELAHCGSLEALEPLRRLTSLRWLGLQGCPVSTTAACVSLGWALSFLPSLEHLDLSSCELPDVPMYGLMGLTRLTHLNLDSAFGGASWAADDWASKLSCLSRLHRLRCLGLGGNELPGLPPAVTGLTQLETLTLGMCPLGDGGLPPGPYLSRLQHLDLRCARCCTLPQHLSSAQQLTYLGLGCCHELALDPDLATNVLGRLRRLAVLTICDQMMGSVDSARAMLALGKALPNLEVTTHDEADEHSGSEDEEDDDDEGYEVELEGSSEEEGSDWEESDDDEEEDSEGEGGNHGGGSEGFSEAEEEEESEWEEDDGSGEPALEGGGSSTAGAAAGQHALAASLLPLLQGLQLPTYPGLLP